MDRGGERWEGGWRGGRGGLLVLVSVRAVRVAFSECIERVVSGIMLIL